MTSSGGTERDAAGGVCGGETDVKRNEGEADVDVAGVVDTDKSVKTDTNVFKIMTFLNILNYIHYIQTVLNIHYLIIYALKWSKNK